ncbi:hypothetical protein B0T22DRAFT_160417 [Podospora appendiculata]|uniref:Uncharacterized protein n=1 Tax=Podospora appendiculata TaxID=314037 RepID=A0AAE0X9P3_9PEZI|nr:hypothetical protein B0T22DRAFT_160417 [Podospora appendiculata]
MDLSRFIFLSAVLARGVCSSPIAAQEVRRDEILSFNPGGPMITAPSSVEYTPVPMTTMNPGGPISPISGSPSPATPSPNISPSPRSASILSVAPQVTPSPVLNLFASQAKGCTTTLSQSSTYPCSWNGCQTFYPYTTVSYTKVDCHGCDYVAVLQDYYYCPNQHVTETKKVSTPSVYWSTVCEPATATPLRIEGDAPPATSTEKNATRTKVNMGVPTPIITSSTEDTVILQAKPRAENSQGQQAAEAACPTTLVVQPGQSAGNTLTTFSRFTTTTVLVNCAGCPLVVTTALAGYGQPGHFTKTITLPVGTATAYSCL